MPKHVQARAAQDGLEARQISKLAGSHHASADWKFHAQLVAASWTGQTPNEIAFELHCHPQTVRVHLARFNAAGISGLGLRPGSGRKRRLTEQDRSRVLALVKRPPPGRLERQGEGLAARDEEGLLKWFRWQLWWGWLRTQRCQSVLMSETVRLAPQQCHGCQDELRNAPSMRPPSLLLAAMKG